MGKGQYLHGGVNAFPTWCLGRVDYYSTEAVAMLWLVMAVLGSKLKA